MDPINVSNPDLWRSLAAIFHPSGIVLLIALAASLYFNRMQWIRLKEKDTECQEERERVLAASQADRKEAMDNVAELTKQVTILTERSTQLRSRADG